MRESKTKYPSVLVDYIKKNRKKRNSSTYKQTRSKVAILYCTIYPDSDEPFFTYYGCLL